MSIAHRPFFWLMALTMISPARAATSDKIHFETAGTPDGFSEIAGPRVSLVDLYYGGRKIGDTVAEVRPGALRFRNPGDVAAKLPDIVDAPELKAILAGELATNAQAVCSLSNGTDCGKIDPQIIGIIYDEERFRVDVFVNPEYLRTIGSGRDLYLPNPDASLSLTNALGFNASGSLAGSSVYNLQNRTIVGFSNARLRANTSVASRLGLVVDDLVAEVDTRGLRYSAGLFWAPGNEFIG